MAPPPGMTRVASHEHQNQEQIMVVASPQGGGGGGGGAGGAGRGGANACLGCCDARIAVIVVNVFLILGGLILIAVGQDGLQTAHLVSSYNNDDLFGGGETKEFAQAVKIMSVVFLIAGIFQLVFVAIGMWGAIAFRAELVRANAGFVAINSLAMFVLPPVIGAGVDLLNVLALVPLAFVRPQLQFAKEVEEGQMGASTYRPACCCCPRPVLLAVPVETSRAVPAGNGETFEDEPQDSIIEMAAKADSF